MKRESIRQMVANSKTQVQNFREQRLEKARQEGFAKVKSEKSLIYKFEREAQ